MGAAVSRGCTCAVQIDLDPVDVLSRFWHTGGRAGDRAAACTDADVAALERFRDLLAGYETVATLFVTGRTLETGRFASIVRGMCREGHEVANHTMDHPADLPALVPHAMEEQIDACAAAIERVTGGAPVGFRAPAYRVDGTVLDLLGRRGYVYDASVLPSASIPLMKAYHALRGGSPPGPGLLRHAGAPRAAHRPWRLPGWSGQPVVEVPVSTAAARWIPLTSTFLMTLPVRVATALVRRRIRTGRPMCITFHLVDMVDGGVLPVRVARRHPASGRDLRHKHQWCARILEIIAGQCRSVTTRRIAEQL